MTFHQLIPGNPLLPELDRLGFTTPTAVQRLAIPKALGQQDLVVQSRTGSGKTMAYAIPLLTKILAAEDSERNVTQVLVVVPTRELAVQVNNVVRSLVGDLLHPVLIIGGSDFSSQEKLLQQDPRIVVGTPGRLLDLIRQRTLKLNGCKFFVLDEADEMLSSGFLQDVRTILSRLPDKRQGIFTSATVTPRVDMLANAFLDRHEVVTVDSTYNDLPSIEHFFCEVGSDLTAKPNALCDIIESQRPNSAIIFCNTKSDTSLVEVLLRRRGFDARRINSDLSQSQRNRVMQKIRNRELRFLVATDVAARGIDIEQIDMVINFAIHDLPEIYLHRTGRTGRAGRSGRAISLVGPRDFTAFHYLKKLLNVDMNKLPLPTADELGEARLVHLHELIRQSRFELSDGDRVVARKLLEEMGVSGAPEELEETIAKLCLHLVQHHVKIESKSLDEELEAQAEESAEDNNGGRQGRRKERRDGDRPNGDRDDRRSKPGRRDDEREPRGGEARGAEARASDDQRPRAQERAPRDGDNRDRRDGGNRQPPREGQRPENAPGNRPQGDDRGPRQRDGRNDRRNDQPRQGEGRQRHEPRGDVRMFVGQGSEHGMTAELFRELANEFAELREDDIKYLVIRERHGFFDINSQRVEKVLENLNGIEYNGHPLPIEVATSLKREETHGGHQHSRRGNGGNDRGGDERRRGGGHGGGHGNRGRDRRDDRGGYRR
ncbi:MAG: DEAD/DEAH box helicase [Deltaproteobacteria bacterium]|nr:DEAD/DEAH box helicase [Deltaproteobacteria bacterium]